jgi:TP901 family phage tail tape measure protein
MPGSTKELQYRIGADFGEVRREAQATGDATRKFMRELDSLEKKQRAHRQGLEELGRGFMTVGAAMVAGLGLAAKAAIEWETAFTGVRKTVDGSDQEIAKLEGELRQLARTLPATHKEIAGVAEAAGQLGIKREDIAGFTKVMIDLGETTNLSAEEAATGLAKLSNIMGVSAKDVDKLGSTLVALGNDGASTEQDILEMGLRIAGAGKQAGMSSDQVLSFASALSSVGVRAEAGGNAMSRVIRTISQAAEAGGKQLETFAQVAGMSAADFKHAWETDAAGATDSFIQGLARMQEQGESVYGVLDKLNLNEMEVSDTLLRAAGASDVFTKALGVGARGWAENIALAEEANKRYATSASKIQVAGNQIKDTMIDVGAVILPVVSSVTQGASDIARGFHSLPGPLKEAATIIGSIAGGFLTLGGAALFAAPKVMAFRDRMGEMVSTGGKFSKALGGFGLFLAGPWGAAIGIGATLLGGLAAAAGAAQRKQEALADAGKNVAQALREQNGVVTQSVRQTAAKAAADAGLLSMAKGMGIELSLVTDAILGQGDAYEKVKSKVTELVGKAAEWNKSAMRGERPSDEVLNANRDLLDGLDKIVGGKNADFEASKNLDAASRESAKGVKALSDETAVSAKQAEEAATALNDMVSAMDKLNQTSLTVREAERSYLESVKATGEALKKNGATLDLNTEAGMENARALDAQAEHANAFAAAAARDAEKMGGATAGAEALKNSLEASRPALLAQAKAFGMGETEAAAYVDQVLAIPTTAQTLITTPGSKAAALELERVRDKVRDIPANKTVDVGVISDAAQKALQDIGYQVTKLPNGHVTVTANTSGAQANLDDLIRRNNQRVVNIKIVTSGGSYLQGHGGKQFVGQAHGGIMSFASGGMYENHAPQIARAQAGTVRVWAEPETGRESYIPWSPSQRRNATQVLSATAAGFGYDLMPRSASVAPFFAQSGGGGQSTMVAFQADGTRIGDVLIEMLRRTIRVQGGNVQNVLGS